MTRIHMAIGFMAALASLPNAQAQPAAPPLDALVFASIAGNACQARETRHTCFVRYTVGRITPASPAGTSPYKFTNSNLQCPAGYSPSVSFDNKLQDTARPNDSIHYY